ncbi:PREDICTED: glucosylceramidase-like [Papilio xuthus]|uniref:Glucosylceramidase n=1 Tax=Papilio xuthus TaxID=66420 RepID=A0AAJ6Z8N1_PAPXU|nr:PREDICTED: glucosylceramidase-like [Papilio xuthus]
MDAASQCSSKERPCAPRPVEGQSVLCVCNTTYCDEFKREIPEKGQYVAYTSSKAGSRFRKSYGQFKKDSYSGKKCIDVLKVDPTKTHQKIQGFGGGITDSAGINLFSLPPNMQQDMINSYFSECGIEYNMGRVPIGGCDFSTHLYAYNEYPIDDTYLTNYSLSYEDYHYKIPIIQAIMNVSTAPLQLVGTVWSPPDWMKNNYGDSGVNRLKDEYMGTYALYFLKFLELYKENNIPFWAITTTNEPLNGVIPLGDFQHLGWTVEKMGEWIKNDLGPMLRNSSFKDVKILAVDDQRYSIPMWFNILLLLAPEAEEYIDGIAVHYYVDKITPASILQETVKDYPNKFVISTEACTGFTGPTDQRVVLGAWDRAETYIVDILENLLNNGVGWIDWNICLDMIGGPNWVQNYVDSPILVNAEKKEFYKQPMFYALGQVTKFVKRHSYRIEMSNVTVCPNPEGSDGTSENVFFCNSDGNDPVYNSAAFLTPGNTIVVIIYNSGDAKSVVISSGDKEALVELEASSITTVEFQNEDGTK